MDNYIRIREALLNLCPSFIKRFPKQLPACSKSPGQELNHQMLSSTKALLDELDNECIADFELGIERLRTLGLTEFALVTNDFGQNKWANIKYVPRTTNDDTQKLFTGNTGTALLAKSVDFVRYFYCQVLTNLVSDCHIKLNDIKILDYGCGWGRLLRLMPYYFSYKNILGVDPWDVAINECEKAGILSPTCLIQRDASDLIGKRFDAGYAFSVFTHLPESLVKKVLANLSSCFCNNGLLIITVRPPEYWSYRLKTAKSDRGQKLYEKALDTHSRCGFSYVPRRGAIEDNFGETSMTTSWFSANINDWKIVTMERSLSDPFQIYLTLKKQ